LVTNPLRIEALLENEEYICEFVLALNSVLKQFQNKVNVELSVSPDQIGCIKGRSGCNVG